MVGNYTGELHPDTEHSGSALLKAVYFHINWFSNTSWTLLSYITWGLNHSCTRVTAHLAESPFTVFGCQGKPSFQGDLGNQDSLGFKV